MSLLRLGLLMVVLTSAFALSACANTTPAGPLGKPIDLRPLLPSDVKARVPAETDYEKIQTAQTQVRVGKPAATVIISWRHFRDGLRAYLLDISFRVLEPSDGWKISGYTEGVPVYIGSRDRTVQVIRVVVKGERGTLTGNEESAVGGLILADGTFQAQ